MVFQTITIEDLCRGRHLGHRLSAHDPDLVVEDQRIVQGPRPPRDVASLVNVSPGSPIVRTPDIVLVMSLVSVTTDDPHLVLVDNVTGGVPPLPIALRIEPLVLERVRLNQRPPGAILRAPDFVVADSGEVHLVIRIPAAEQPHTILEHQRPRAVPRSVCRGRGDVDPLIIQDFL